MRIAGHCGGPARRDRRPAGAIAKRYPPALAATAFTLIELIVSTSLMAIILGSAYLCFGAGVDSRKVIETRSDIAQTARVAMALMTADLRAATPLSGENDFLGMNRDLEGLEADNLDFATHHHRPAGKAQADWAEISYYVDKDQESGLFHLYRRRDPTPDPETTIGGSKELIAENVRGLRFMFYDGFDWHEEWGDPTGKQRFSELPPPNIVGIPEAIQITIALGPPNEVITESTVATNRPSSLTFQTIVRPELAGSRWNGPQMGGQD